MVTQGLINIILRIFGSIFRVLPDISINVQNDVYVTFMDMVSGVIYLLPIDTIFIIFSIITTIWTFKILIAIPKAIWEVLPIV